MRGMGQIIAVLLQLLFDPFLADIFAFQFNVQNIVPIGGYFQKVKFLADVLNDIRDKKTIQTVQPGSILRSGGGLKIRDEPIGQLPECCRFVGADHFIRCVTGKCLQQQGHGFTVMDARK